MEHRIFRPACLLFFVSRVLALPETLSESSSGLDLHPRAIISTFGQVLLRASRGKVSLVGMVACSPLPLLLFWWMRRKRLLEKYPSISSADESSHNETQAQNVKDTDLTGNYQIAAIQNISDSYTLEAEASDPGLLKKHSEIKTFTTSQYTYRKIRVFFREHPQFAQLPTTPSPLPLLVFVSAGGVTFFLLAPCHNFLPRRPSIPPKYEQSLTPYSDTWPWRLCCTI
jgi:hypothetical protein